MRIIFVLFFSLGILLNSLGQHIHFQNTDSVISGTLGNGFSYVVHSQPVSVGRVEIRFVVNAGSLNEKSDEVEYAHLVEHLIFQGTRNFPGDSAIRFFASKGMRFGRDVNAYTGGVNTVYELSLPAGDTLLIKQALLVLKDWAQDVVFGDERIRNSIEVVLGEIRYKSGGEVERIDRKVNSWLLRSSRYGEGNLQARLKSLHNIDAKRVTDFYKKWYRSNLQGLVVVGDVDSKYVVEQVGKTFSDLNNIGVVRSPDYSKGWKVPLLKDNRVEMIDHPSLTGFELQLYRRWNKDDPALNIADKQKNNVLNKLCQALIAKRFQGLEISVGTNCDATMISELYASGIGFIKLSEKFEDPERLKRAVYDFAVELKRLQLHGASEDELELVRKSTLEEFQGDGLQSASFLASKYVDQFSGKSASVSLQDLSISEVLDNISNKEVQDRLRLLVAGNRPTDILILYSPKQRLSLPNEASLQQALKTAGMEKNLKPWMKAGLPESLVEIDKLKRNVMKVSSTTAAWRNSNIQEIKMGNGISIILNSTKDSLSFQNNRRVQLIGYSPGGLQMYEGFKRLVALSAPGVVYQSGIGSFDRHTLDRMHTEKDFKVVPALRKNCEIIEGKSSPRSLEQLFQLMYLYINSPRKDSAAFALWKRNRLKRLEEQSHDKRKSFRSQFVFGALEDVIDANDLESINLNEVFRIYRERFSAVNDFTFFISGDFDVDTVRHLAELYLGNLPMGNKDNIKQLSEKDRSRNLKNQTLYYGNEDRADVHMIGYNSTPHFYSERNRLILDLLVDIFRKRMFKRLREEAGGTYTPRVFSNYNRLSKDTGEFRIEVVFECAPNNVDHLVGLVNNEITSISISGIEAGEFNEARSEKINEIKQEMKGGISAWKMMEIYRFGDDPENFINRSKLVREISVNEVNESLKKYFNIKMMKTFLMLPEKYRK